MKEEPKEKIYSAPADSPIPLPPDKRYPFVRRYLLFLLVLGLIPLLVYAVYFQMELKYEQEAALKRGYSDNAAYIMSGIDAKLNESRDVLVNLGRNYSLQNLLSPPETGPRLSEVEYLSPVEAYIWYHLSSSRSAFTDIQIYASGVRRQVGHFIRPYSALPAPMLAEWQAKGNFTELSDMGQAPDQGERTLYFIHAIQHQRSNWVMGYIVAKLDPAVLFSKDLVRDTKANFAFQILLDGKVLTSYVPKGLSGPLAEVSAKGDYAGMEINLFVPLKFLTINLVPPLLAFFCSTVLALIVAFYLVRRIRQMGEDIDRDRRHIEALRLTALRNQINPHFLYNILSMINWKAKYAGVPEISEMVTDLSSFYRLSLNHGRETILLSDEFKTIYQYLKLKTKLMDQPPEFTLNLPKELETWEVVNFILQPLAENAVVHGVAGLERPCHIEVGAAVSPGGDDGELWLWVWDDGRGISPEDFEAMRQAEGYGLRNVDSRVKLQSGRDCGLRLYSGDGRFVFGDDQSPWQGLPEAVEEMLKKAEKQGCLALIRLRRV